MAKNDAAATEAALKDVLNQAETLELQLELQDAAPADGPGTAASEPPTVATEPETPLHGAEPAPAPTEPVAAPVGLTAPVNGQVLDQGILTHFSGRTADIIAQEARPAPAGPFAVNPKNGEPIPVDSLPFTENPARTDF